MLSSLLAGRRSCVCRVLLWVALILSLFTMRYVWAQEAECAEVKIVIEQKLSLERQAFDARMLISNGLDSSALTDVKIELFFQDRDNNPVIGTTDANAVGAKFFYRTDSLSGINNLENGNIAAKSAAEIHWLIIPAAGTGGVAPSGTLYYVGAKVTYTLLGKTSTVDVTPDYIVVRPQPLLQLDYFLPQEVHGDDPWTAEVEAPEPYTLGVRIKNNGGGTSYKTTIESAQPKIVENRQGLLIDFQILGGYVNDGPAGKSLLLNFGDIAGGTSTMGRWNMITTLSGRFTSFDASYTHAADLGGAVTSLIDAVTTHTLVRDVKVDLPGRDSVRDFLAKDVDVMRVYESDGTDNRVTDLSAEARTSQDGQALTLTFNAQLGFVYARVEDPWQGTRPLSRVVRSDGKLMLAENVWLSKVQKVDLSWAYYINVFDANSTGSYSFFTSETGAPSRVAGAVYNDANGNGLREPEELGIGLASVVLKGSTRDGVEVSISNFTDPQGQFAFAGLKPGTYTVQVGAVGGLVDGVVAGGSSGGTVAMGKVSGIEVNEGSAIDGLLFAKKAPAIAVTSKADLSLAASLSNPKPKKNETTVVTFTARNSGPDAAGSASVVVSIPAGLTLESSQPSAGTFSAGTWAIGSLASGQSQTLLLTLRAASLDQEKTIAANIGSTIPDPNSANNSAFVLVQRNLETAGVRVEQSSVDSPRLAVLAGCSDPVALGNGQASACADAKANAAKAYFEGKGFIVATYTSVAEFRKAVRGGYFNTLWISSGATVSTELSEEVRASVRQGSLVVLESSDDIYLQSFSDVWGGSLGAALAPGNSIVWDGAAAPYAIAQAVRPLIRQSAQQLAQFSTGETAIASGRLGLGSALVLGFDFLEAQKQASPTNALETYLAAQLIATLQQPAETRLALSYAPIQLGVENTGESALQATAKTTLPAGVEWRDAQPVPQDSANQTLTWDMDLPVSARKAVTWMARLPQQTGSANLQTQVTAPALEVPGSASKVFAVVGADQVMDQAAAKAMAMTSDVPEQQTVLDGVRAAIQSAQQAYDAGQYEAAIAKLVEVERSLRGSTLAGKEALRDDIAGWIVIAGRMLEQASKSYTLTVVSGTPQTAAPGAVFTNALVVKVQDAAAQGVGGVGVDISLPSSGASAAFADQYRTAFAVTDAAGLATFSAPTANATEGTYQALATVAGAPAPAMFSLSNTKPPVVTKTILTLLDGDTQSAVVGAAFSRALRVKVIDENGQAKAGVSVRFVAPGAGATATLDGSATFTIVSGADGIAASPVPVATGVPGTYTVTATAAGAEAAVLFHLTNTPPAAGGGTTFTGTTATGTGTVTATISGGGPTCAFNPAKTHLVPADGVPALLQRILLPHGLFEFELVDCVPGGVVTVSTTWPNLRGITGYLKYGPTPATGLGKKVWYVPNNLQIRGNTVTYTIRDGGLGDDDLLANGRIVDPGGPVIQADAPGVDDAYPVPGLSFTWLMALAGLLAVLAGLHVQRPGRSR